MNAKEGIESGRANSKPTTNAHGEHNTHGTYKTLKQQLDQKTIYSSFIALLLQMAWLLKLITCHGYNKPRALHGLNMKGAFFTLNM